MPKEKIVFPFIKHGQEGYNISYPEDLDAANDLFFMHARRGEICEVELNGVSVIKTYKYVKNGKTVLVIKRNSNHPDLIQPT